MHLYTALLSKKRHSVTRVQVTRYNESGGKYNDKNKGGSSFLKKVEPPPFPLFSCSKVKG